MKNFFLSLFFSLIIFPAYAQQPPIMVCNAAGTTCTPYTTLDAAVIAASAGSYIYLPGGTFSLSTVIRKELHLFGAGHYPDSTVVTGITIIAGTVTVDTGCSNSSFEGLRFSTLSVPGTNGGGTVFNVRFTRCNIGNLNLHNSVTYVYNYAVTCNSCLIKDCVIGGFNPLCISCTISNCILTSDIANVRSSIVNNCILFGSFYYNTSSGTSSYNNTIRNNVFDSTDLTRPYQCSGCVLTNNLTTNSTIGLPGATSETGTIATVPIGNLFVNATTIGFDYTKDFHLKSTSPGHNAGTDGTDLGIYGSNVPYVTSAVPGNPHFFHKNVSGTTDATGNLQVQFKVRATH